MIGRWTKKYGFKIVNNKVINYGIEGVDKGVDIFVLYKYIEYIPFRPLCGFLIKNIK